MSDRGEEIIAETLRGEGLDARVDGGWVYVYLPERDGKDARVLWIGAEYGASLDATVSPRFVDRATEGPT